MFLVILRLKPYKVCRYVFQIPIERSKMAFSFYQKQKCTVLSRIWKSSLKMKWLRNFPPFFATQVFDLLGFTLTGIYKNEKKEHSKKL